MYPDPGAVVCWEDVAVLQVLPFIRASSAADILVLVLVLVLGCCVFKCTVGGHVWW
jgi:hypothetical protein